jgi:hypothetical protein
MHIRLQPAGRQFSTPQNYGLSPEKRRQNDVINNHGGAHVFENSQLEFAMRRARQLARRCSVSA